LLSTRSAVAVDLQSFEMVSRGHYLATVADCAGCHTKPGGKPFAGGGSRGVGTAEAPTSPAMPSFGWRLTDAQVASLLTFVRNSWGNAAPAVSSDQVIATRSSLAGGSN
jgi:mono/diheme cytochrome c family protein